MRWLLVLSLGMGCGSPNPDGVSPSNQVTVVEADVQVAPDRLTLARSGNEALLDRQPGDVLVSGRGTGFLRKVVTVERSGDQIVIATQPAALSDALGTALYDGSFHDSKADISGPSFNGVYVGFGGLEIQSGTDVDVHMTKGSVNFSPSLDLSLDTSWGRVTTFDLVASGTFTSELGFHVHTDGPAEIRYQKDLWTSPPATFYQQIGPIPVVEVVEVVVTLEVNGSTEGATDLDVGASAMADLAVGARYYDGEWHRVGDHSLTLQTDGPSLTTTNDLQMQVLLPIELHVSFYDLAGPYVSLEPKLQATYTADQGIVASWGLESLFGGSVNLLGAGNDSRVLGFEGNLFDFDCPFGTPVADCLQLQ
jgi:hypothetical protein